MNLFLVCSATAVSNDRALLGLSPTPTPDAGELRRRQASQVTVQTLLAAPDNTCGYFYGNSAAPWGCTTGNCVFATPTVTTASNGTKEAGAVLCCDPTTGCPTTPAPTACVDRSDYNKTCTGSCTSDPEKLKCTSGIYIWCNTITFTTPNISAFFCNYISTSSPIPAETTFSGQAGHAFTTTIAKFATTSAPSTSCSSATEGPSSPENSATAAGAVGRNGTKHSNKGGIIGGVVGGVLGLALIVGAVMMCLRRRNSQEPAPATKAGGELDWGSEY
ncbi:hypothetical protein L207DRAFT_634955 [Hyaloscypha variabilis F]|uniref:Mid2 domain-containing protein n=1 Tax=Hyaloscypha variabilis (strain UAMH 11265 / GT02V1 / F) TaxID=1149755 RepID=A0A2J6RKB9_HYAVF|nr:hypothetical protein L207DRAFT_634955 [Hyaloscypha variabilis F]